MRKRRRLSSTRVVHKEDLQLQTINEFIGTIQLGKRIPNS